MDRRLPGEGQRSWPGPVPRHLGRPLRRSDALSCLPYTVIHRGRRNLVVHGDSGAWCLLDDDALPLLGALRSTSFGDLCALLGCVPESIHDFLVRLYEYGLISVNGAVVLGERGPQERRLSILVLKVTDHCNLRCDYCYNRVPDRGARSRPRELGIDVARRAVDGALDACGPSLMLVLHGGEPFLRPRFVRSLVEYARRVAVSRKKELHIVAQTNGTVLSSDLISFIRAEGIGLGVSLDGPAALNDTSRVDGKKRGTSGRVHENLARLMAEGVPVNIITVVTSLNARRLGDVAKHFDSLGVASLKFSPFLSQANEGRSATRSPAPEDAAAGLEAVVEAIRSRSVWRLQVEDVVDRIRSILLRESASVCRSSPCGAGREILAVMPDGDIYACDCLQHPTFLLGNLRLLSVAEAADHPSVARLRRRTVDTLSPCGRCALRRICGGVMTCRAFWEGDEPAAVQPRECRFNRTVTESLMWSLLSGPELMEYFFRHSRDRPVQPYVIRRPGAVE